MMTYSTVLLGFTAVPAVCVLTLTAVAPEQIDTATSIASSSTVIAAAIVTVIAALVGGSVTVVNAISAAADRKDARLARHALSITTSSTDKKADTLIEKAVEIHTLTNSNLSKVTSALEVAMAKISGLEKLVVSMSDAKHVADTLAVSVSMGTTPAVAPAPTDAPGVRIAEATERGADAHERAATAQVEASKIQRTAADTQARAAEINKQSDK